MNIAIDLGKRRSYVVMEDNDIILKEGYTETSKDGFSTFFGPVNNPNIIVEASSTVNRIANIFDGYDITVAHPARVRLIAESVKKTDKIDAHTILDLYKKDYLPRSWLPPKITRDERDLCRDRAFLGRQKTTLKNKIRYNSYCLGIEFKYFNKKNMKMLKDNPKLRLLTEELENTLSKIEEYEKLIGKSVELNHYAKLIDTVPGIGRYSALAIASEIGNVNRFKTEQKLLSYAGLVPVTYQSGDKEWKGHIAKGNTFIKTVLVECVGIHIIKRKDSKITYMYNEIKDRRGRKVAKIAAAKRLLRIIYWMLKRNEEYHDR